jgi:hypothetical protein
MVYGDLAVGDSRSASRDFCRDKRVNAGKRWLSNRWSARSYSICRQGDVLRHAWNAYDWASRNNVYRRKRIIFCKRRRRNGWCASRDIVGCKRKVFNRKPTVCQWRRCEWAKA